MLFDVGIEHRQNPGGTSYAVNASGQKHRIITPECVRHQEPPFGGLYIHRCDRDGIGESFASYSGEQNRGEAHSIVFHVVSDHSSGTVKMRYFPSWISAPAIVGEALLVPSRPSREPSI